MISLKFKVTNQTITRQDTYVPVSGSKNYLQAQFVFTAEWNGVIKHAVFSRDGIASVDLTLINDSCPVPYAMTAEPGAFTVSVYGGELITANSEEVEIYDSGYIQTEPTPPPETEIYVKSPTGIGAIHLIKTIDGVLWQYNGTTWEIVEGKEGKQGIQGEKGDKPAHEWNGTQLRFENVDGTFGEYIDLKGETGNTGNTGPTGLTGDKGDKGDPSTIDKLGTAAAVIDLADIEKGVYGTVASPLTVAENTTISFENLSLAAGYQKSFIVYVKRTAAVSVTWQNITKWAYDEIPLLPVNEVQKILIETSDGVNYYGTEGDYFNV